MTFCRGLSSVFIDSDIASTWLEKKKRTILLRHKFDFTLNYLQKFPPLWQFGHSNDLKLAVVTSTMRMKNCTIFQVTRVKHGVQHPAVFCKVLLNCTGRKSHSRNYPGTIGHQRCSQGRMFSCPRDENAVHRIKIKMISWF